MVDANRILTSLVTSPYWTDLVAILKLSPRERQIVECIVVGIDSELLIAERLGIPRRTVHEHVSRLYLKLGVTNRAQLALSLFAAYIERRRVPELLS